MLISHFFPADKSLVHPAESTFISVFEADKAVEFTAQNCVDARATNMLIFSRDKLTCQ